MGVGVCLRRGVVRPGCNRCPPRGVRALAVVYPGKTVRRAVGHNPDGRRPRGRRLRQRAGAADRGALPAEHRRDLLHVPAPRLSAWRPFGAGLCCQGGAGCLRPHAWRLRLRVVTELVSQLRAQGLPLSSTCCLASAGERVHKKQRRLAWRAAVAACAASTEDTR